MPKFRDMYIVLADDDSDDRELFSEALEGAGVEVNLETVPDGESLMNLLNASEILPDLIFVDLNMPNKNGKDCLTEIRDSDVLNHIPVIIYSTSSSPKDIEETFEYGANLYVTKPSTFADLKQVTSSVISMNWDKQRPRSNKNNFLFNRNNL